MREDVETHFRYFVTVLTTLTNHQIMTSFTRKSATTNHADEKRLADKRLEDGDVTIRDDVKTLHSSDEVEQVGGLVGAQNLQGNNAIIG